MAAIAPSLVIEGIGRSFGGVKAVSDVSFTLRAGEALALVGPNGAGKSTLIQLISGADSIDAGSVRLGDRRIDGLGADRIAALGIRRTFQTSRVFPALSVLDGMLIGTHLTLLDGPGGRRMNPVLELLCALVSPPSWRIRKRQQENQVNAALELFGDRLTSRRHQPAFSLSYANRRRLEIARVLAASPHFLLLDEPAAGMNPSETQELTDLLIRLREQRPSLGMLIVEHKLSLVRRIADRAIVLNQGSILVEDSPDRALDHPEVVEAYLGRRSAQRASTEAHLG